MHRQERPPGTRRPSPGPVRRNPAEYLGAELVVARIGPLPGAFFGLGVLAGAGLGVWQGTVPAVVAGATALGGALGWWWLRRRHRRNLAKGYVAERQIGRAQEQAVTAEGCAVAHNVTGILDSGDIDHIVATPSGVRVVEEVPPGALGAVPGGAVATARERRGGGGAAAGRYAGGDLARPGV